MGIFRKTADTNDELALTDTLPEYVDKLLDEADLDSIQESDAISLPNTLPGKTRILASLCSRAYWATYVL